MPSVGTGKLATVVVAAAADVSVEWWPPVNAGSPAAAPATRVTAANTPTPAHPARRRFCDTDSIISAGGVMPGRLHRPGRGVQWRRNVKVCCTKRVWCWKMPPCPESG